ncbi:dipeptide ABC transporter ATP-binding protein [Promicromonospora soli]|uniref:Peptide ABC transporter ATP-binding protein n=1 Tax=Promicromonospora soli TaxID=2035533 RepID=A0A919FFP7_9MICO|nr:ABC transporter ATP-binding protein [Promicromonospora soli]GHH64408.1 peptide ABC transporter ATP-binding protein [Promicromonospora soli]
MTLTRTVTARTRAGTAAPDRATEDAAGEPAAPGGLLRVRGLRVAYGDREVVHGVDLDVRPGEVVALVGESGSGKSTTAHALIGLLPDGGRVTSGEVALGVEPLTGLLPDAWRRVRGVRVGLVPQDPGTALDPVMRVGDQVAEALVVHGTPRRAARERAVEILREVGLDHPGERARQYPHQLSGGMRQRVLVGIAMACEPELVIADEPTSALDVTVQRRVLDLLADLAGRAGTAVLLITHDLAVAADRADRVVVLKDGVVVEEGPAGRVLGAPEHPYTRELVAAVPGTNTVPSAAVPAGPAATTSEPAAPSTALNVPPQPVLLAAHALVKEFRLGRRERLRAVDDVSFTVPRGSTFALVGESGSGKSTTARLVLGLDRPSAGVVELDGAPVGGDLATRRRTQLVHQDPYSSLDPRFTVAAVVEEPLRAHRVGTRAERADRVAQLLEQVHLSPDLARRRPAELSGGQRQRVAIARALALDPELLVLDEPTSALDVSVQARVLALLARLRAERGLTYLFISHDLAVVRQVADHVGVMRNGQLVETGPVGSVFDHPAHPYTAELLAAIPGARTRRHPDRKDLT